MDILSPTIDLNTFSLLDLLHARDQFHPHLMNEANVVGTPSATDTVTGRTARTPKPPRTLANSEVRPHSWPCILLPASFSPPR